MTDDGEYDYTGSNITGIDIENLYDNTKKLVLNKDYTLDIPEKINAGSYQLTVNGKGDYTGSFILSYKIIPASISGAVISAIPNQKYTGSAITPVFTVTLNGNTLSSTTDYTTSYQNNTDIGTATVKITGKGNYRLEKTSTFQIYGNVNANYDESTKYVEISWTLLNSSSTYFKIFKQTKTNGNWVDVSTSPIYSDSKKTYSYNMGYDTAGEYRFKVLEYTNSSQSNPNDTQYSNSVTIEPPKPNLAPTNFNVKPNSSGKFVVFASEPAGLVNAQKMILEVSADGNAWIDVDYFYTLPSSGTDTSISDANKQALNMKDGAIIYFRACFVSSGDVKGPYTDVVTCKYENFKEKRDNQLATAGIVEKEEPVATPGGGYSMDTLTIR